MLNLQKFTNDHLFLCVCTLGTAILGYLGYHAIIWIIKKCSKTEKTDALFKNIIGSAQWKTIANSLKEYKATWKHLAKTKEAREQFVEKLKSASNYSTRLPQAYNPNEYPTYKEHLGLVHSLPGNFGMWMPGVALVASYLTEKKKVEGLYVCQTLESLSKQIHQISLNPADQRCAFIVGTRPSGFDLQPNFPQHKATVCVEKKEGKLSIALLDPQPDPKGNNKEIAPENLTEDLWSGYHERGAFNAQEVVFRAILSACRKSKCQARLLHSQVIREKIYGCATFALQDALSYLQDPNFFNRIHCSQEKMVQIDQQYGIEVITALPPEYMIGTQSTALLEEYRNQGGQFDTPLPGKKKTLQAYLDRHSVEVKENEGVKKQNHYITKKSFKYLNLVSLFLKLLNSKEIEQISSKVLR